MTKDYMRCLDGRDHPGEALKLLGFRRAKHGVFNRYRCTLCGKEFDEEAPPGGARAG